MVFPNFYYKRTAATAKACYICYKPTVIVLATIDTVDFFYTCPIHLTDPGFATRVLDPEPEPKKPSVSPEEIAKVKQEWKEKQRQQKKDKEEKREDKVDGDGKKSAEGAQKDGEAKDADSRIKADGNQEPATVAVAPNASGSALAESLIPRPTHERYILHRNIYALRTADHLCRRQTAETRHLAPRLPGVPRGLSP